MSLHRIIVLAIVALLALPGTAAFAQDATEDGYGDDSGQVQDTVAETTEEEEPAVAGESAAPTATAAPQTTQETLPFTGGDEVIIALAGALLVGTGVAMRRLSRTG